LAEKRRAEQTAHLLEQAATIKEQQLNQIQQQALAARGELAAKAAEDECRLRAEFEAKLQLRLEEQQSEFNAALEKANVDLAALEATLRSQVEASEVERSWQAENEVPDPPAADYIRRRKPI
jgi:hypothetical protein